jgi:predicted aconitase with swiveling domain
MSFLTTIDKYKRKVRDRNHKIAGAKIVKQTGKSLTLSKKFVGGRWLSND